MIDFETRGYYIKIDATIKKIRNYFQKRFDEANLDITVEQWVVLDNAYRNEGITQIELTELVFKDAPTLTRIIDLLVKKDILLRKVFETDRRKFAISVTTKGQETFKKALPIAIEARKLGWNNMSDEDFSHFYRILDTLNDNFS